MKTKYSVCAIVLALSISAPVFAEPASEPDPLNPTSAEPVPMPEWICDLAPDCTIVAANR